MDVEEESTVLLRTLLRRHREGLRRGDVGLPNRPGGRNGLSQEDLGLLTGYGTRAIANLENGRGPRPPAEMLDAVADVLRLRTDERGALWRLATGMNPPLRDYSTEENPSLARMVEAQYPHPAFLVDGAMNILFHNRAVAEWFVDFDTMPERDRNWAVWLFTSPHAPHVFVGWPDDVGPKVLSRLRAAKTRFRTDARVAAVIEDLRQRSDYVRTMWYADGGLYVDAPTERRWLRRPGHTDTDQSGDGHQVLVDVVTLGSHRPADERRVIAMYLPAGFVPEPGVRSLESCRACRG